MAIPTDGQWHSNLAGYSLGDLAGFSLAGQPASHLIFLCAGLFLLGFSLVVSIMALFDRNSRFRLLWAIASLIAVGKATLFWIAGGGDFYPISIQIPAMSLLKIGPNEWLIDFGVPVFAMAYLYYRMKRIRERIEDS